MEQNTQIEATGVERKRPDIVTVYLHPELVYALKRLARSERQKAAWRAKEAKRRAADPNDVDTVKLIGQWR